MKKITIETLDDWKTFAGDVSSLISLNKTEWEKRYAVYAEKILKKWDAIMTMRRRFRERKSLHVYTSIYRVYKEATKTQIDYDLRFHGQSVATLRVSNDTVSLIETSDQCKKLNEHFEPEEPEIGYKLKKRLSDKKDSETGEKTEVPWKSDAATEFGKYYAKFG